MCWYVGIQSLVWPCWQLTPCSKSSQVVKPRPQVFMASFKLRSKCRNKLLIVTNTATSCLLIAPYKRANAYVRSWRHGVPICEEQWARHSWRFDEHASSDVAFYGVTTIHKLHKGEVNVERKVCLGVKLQQSTCSAPSSIFLSLGHWLSILKYFSSWREKNSATIDMCDCSAADVKDDDDDDPKPSDNS